MTKPWAVLADELREMFATAPLPAVGTPTKPKRRVRPEKMKTHCKHGHALEGENLMVRSDGRRNCRYCAADRTFEHRLRVEKRGVMTHEERKAPVVRPDMSQSLALAFIIAWKDQAFQDIAAKKHAVGCDCTYGVNLGVRWSDTPLNGCATIATRALAGEDYQLEGD